MSVQFPNKPDHQHNPYATPITDFDSGEFEYHTEPFYSRHGRIGRLRYMAYNVILTFLLYLVCIVIFALGVAVANALNNDTLNGVLMVIGIVLLVPISCYAFFVPAIRRLNDLNRSGWLCLLMFIPYLNILFSLYLMLAPGDDGYNDYGVPAMPPSLRVKVVALAIPIIALIGILAAIALPAYQDYVMRANAAEAQAIIQQ